MTAQSRVIFVPRGPKGNQGVKGDDGNSSVDTGRVDGVLDILITNVVIYWSENGNDLNDGKQVGNAVQTWQRVCELMEFNKQNYVYVIGDVVMDYYVSTKGNTFLNISKATGATNAKITVMDSSNHGSLPGGFWMRGGSGLYLNSVDIHLDSSKGPYGMFGLWNGVGSAAIYIYGSTITQSLTNSARLFFASDGSRLHADLNATSLSNISEIAFHSVAAGANPNSHHRYSSNVTLI